MQYEGVISKSFSGLCLGNLYEICMPVTLHMWHQRIM